MNTAELTEAILLAASDKGHRLFRNNSGVAKHVKRDKAGKLKTWVVPYGVGPAGGGGGDLLGWCRGTGRFASVEVKIGNDTQTADQRKWQRWVVAGGGVAGVARTVEDALRILEAGAGT